VSGFGVTSILIAFSAGSLTKVAVLAALVPTRIRRIGVSRPPPP
jgi:hypothetical protein